MCTIRTRNIWVAHLKVKVTAWPWSKIVSGSWLRYLESDFKTISQKWSPYWDDVSRTIFGAIPWRSMSQHDLAATSCMSNNFVIWSRILLPFHRNDHHIEMTCHPQHLVLPWRSRPQHDLAANSCLPNDFVIWSRILLLFHRNDHHIEMTCHAQHLGRYLEGQGQSMTLKQSRVRPITLLFEGGL